MIEHIPELIDAGIDSLKIEGRMKTALYVATVARTYRKALDDFQKDPKLSEKHAVVYWNRYQIVLIASLQRDSSSENRMKTHRFMTAIHM